MFANITNISNLHNNQTIRKKNEIHLIYLRHVAFLKLTIKMHNFYYHMSAIQHRRAAKELPHYYFFFSTWWFLNAVRYPTSETRRILATSGKLEADRVPSKIYIEILSRFISFAASVISWKSDSLAFRYMMCYYLVSYQQP